MCVRRPMRERRVNAKRREEEKRERERKITRNTRVVAVAYLINERKSDLEITFMKFTLRDLGRTATTWPNEAYHLVNEYARYLFFSLAFSFVYNLFENWIMYRRKTHRFEKEKRRKEEEKHEASLRRPINYEIWSWQTLFVGDDNVNEMRMAYQIVFFFFISLSRCHGGRLETHHLTMVLLMVRVQRVGIESIGGWLFGRSVWRQLRHIAFQVINWAFGCSTMALSARRRDTT